MTSKPHEHIRIVQRNGTTLVECTHDELIDEDLIQHWGNELFELVESPDCDKLAVSFLGVGLVASAALGKLVTLHRRMHRKGGRIVFCELQEPIRDILRTCRLDEFFTLAGTREEAVAALE